MDVDADIGWAVLGADPVYGPPSPADLAKLDRKLTPAEQKAVDDYQTIIQAQRGPARSQPMAAWKIALLAAGGAIGLGAVIAVARR